MGASGEIYLFYYEDRTTVHILKKRLIRPQKRDKTI